MTEGSSSTPVFAESRLRTVELRRVSMKLAITFIVTLMVISSPIVIFVNPALVATTSNMVDTSNDHATVSISPSTSIKETSPSTTVGTPTIQAAICCLTARPTNNIVNTNSFYDVVFLTSTSAAIKTIQVTFPSGTAIPSGAFFNEAEGIGPGIASKSGQTITYTVTDAVNVPAGTKIRLEFANINNPIQVSANYKVTVTTRNAANTIIDGPTQSTPYTIKQIGTNAIADGHITTPKIADGAIQPQIITRFGDSVSVAPESVNSGIAFCLIGEVAVGGAATVSVDGRGLLTIMNQSPQTGTPAWIIEMYNSDPTNSHSFTPKAFCMPAMP